MKVIDRSEYRDEEGRISVQNRIRGTLDHGLDWYGEMYAQEQVSQRLSASLGDDHTLVRNVSIPGTDISAPMILISPQGVRVLYPSAARGVFRAKGDEWLAFSGGRFKKIRPNLQSIVLTMAESVLNYLQGRGFPLPEVEPVLVFTNPRTHVDMARPKARIVLADAIDHFAANLQQFPPMLNRDDTNALVESLLNPQQAEAETEAELPREPLLEQFPSEAEEFSLDELMADEAEVQVEKPPDVLIIGPLRMTRLQWIVVGFLAFLEVIVLGALAAMVLANMIFR